jgi:transcriptional regulator with XRE-family HTH domain
MSSNEQTPHINVDYFAELTGDIAPEGTDSPEAMGQRIRALREERGYSLAELAARTGFDADLLARIEKQEVYPQLGTVIKLSKALDAAFGGLLSGAGDKPYAVTRKADRKTIHRSTSGKGARPAYAYKSLAPEVKGRTMEPLLVTLAAQPEQEVSTHQGEEFIFVLTGVVLLQIGDDRFELEPGDSAYYLSSTPHFIAAKEGEATILAVLQEG